MYIPPPPQHAGSLSGVPPPSPPSPLQVLQLDMMIQTSFGKYADAEFEIDEATNQTIDVTEDRPAGLGLETVDYFAILGGVLTLWLGTIYFKVVQVH